MAPPRPAAWSSETRGCYARARLSRVRTKTSASSTGYKQQIHDQLEAALLPEGSVALELSFAVGPKRNWLSLWKPTIDARGVVLGQAVPGHEWHTPDGRIVPA